MIKKSKKEEIGTISTLKNEKAKNQSEETVFFSGILALFGYA